MTSIEPASLITSLPGGDWPAHSRPGRGGAAVQELLTRRGGDQAGDNGEHRSRCREACSSGLKRQPQRPGGERDRVVPAAQQYPLQRSVLAGGCDQVVPLLIGQVVLRMQRVDGSQYGAVCGRIPARVAAVSVYQRADMRAGQVRFRGTDADVDRPLVLGTAQSRGSVDDQLAVTQ